MDIQPLNNIFVFDLDNTLIKTDKANNLAYADAIRLVLGQSHVIVSDRRFTRNDLKNLFPSLLQTQLESIISHKERSFKSYIGETVLNINLFEILKQLYCKGYHTILLTNSHSWRAIQLCSYYNISQYFVQQFFHEDCLENKYSFLKSLGYDLQSVILYENDESLIQEAVNNGINLENIIKVEF